MNTIFNAIRSENLNEVRTLLNKDASLINSKDQRGSTPLLLSTYYGFTDITKLILEHKPNINEQDASGNTALMGVCFKGKDNKGYTAEMHAKNQGLDFSEFIHT